MHSVCKAFPSFLLLTWLRCLQNWVLVASCIPVLLMEGWGGGMNLLLWRLTEMCLCVAKSPVLEADGEFKQQLQNLPKPFKFDLEDHGNLLTCLGGAPVLRHGEENHSPWAPCGGARSSAVRDSAMVSPGTVDQFSGEYDVCVQASHS